MKKYDFTLSFIARLLAVVVLLGFIVAATNPQMGSKLVINENYGNGTSNTFTRPNLVGDINTTNVDLIRHYDSDETATRIERDEFGNNTGSTYTGQRVRSTNETYFQFRVGGVSQVPLRLTRGHGITWHPESGNRTTNDGDMEVTGTLTVATTAGPTNTASRWGFGDGANNITVNLDGLTGTLVASNFVAHVDLQNLATNATATTNLYINLTNTAVRTIYPTNHLRWTNLVGFNAALAPNTVFYVYPQFTLTNHWPVGSMHGYHVRTNQGAPSPWLTFTSGVMYSVSIICERTNVVILTSAFQ